MSRRREEKISVRDERGQTMAEFAFVFPLLALLLFAVIQFGIVFNNYLTITDAARAGARKAAVSLYGGSKDGIGAGTAAAKASAENLDASKLKVAVSASPSWKKGADVKVTVSYPYSISLLGMVVKSGDLTSATTERIE